MDKSDVPTLVDRIIQRYNLGAFGNIDPTGELMRAFDVLPSEIRSFMDIGPASEYVAWTHWSIRDKADTIAELVMYRQKRMIKRIPPKKEN